MKANIPFYRLLHPGVDSVFSSFVLSVWVISLFYNAQLQESQAEKTGKNTQQTGTCYLTQLTSQNYIIECYQFMVVMIWVNK